MRRPTCSIVALFFAVMVLTGGQVILAADGAGSLVTGQDQLGQLDGWEYFSEDPNTRMADVWTLTDDVVVCKGTPKGYIYTPKDYSDFVLTLQWRWPTDGAPDKPANGGVLVRMTGGHKIWPKSLEAQINAGSAGDFWGLDGYALQGPPERSTSVDHPQFGKLTNVKKLKAVEKPRGQWNQYEIVAKGGTVTLKINGQLVNTATNCDTTPGRICLTAEGNEIHFRDIRLTTRDP